MHLCAGLIGWVPNTDTLHALIREYRDARKIPLNVEHRLMLGMAPDYDHLTVIQKVEVFEHALDSTSGAHPCSPEQFYHHVHPRKRNNPRIKFVIDTGLSTSPQSKSHRTRLASQKGLQIFAKWKDLGRRARNDHLKSLSTKIP